MSGLLEERDKILKAVMKSLEKNHFFESISNEYFGTVIPNIDAVREDIKKRIELFIQMGIGDYIHEKIKEVMG